MQPSQKIRIFLLGCLAFPLFLGCQKKTPDVSEAEPEVAVEAEQEPKGFSQLEWKIVDRNKAMAENPALVEVVNETDATGYMEAVSQSHFAAVSKLNTAQMEYNSKLQSFIDATDNGGADPKPQTFEEFSKAAKMNSNNMKGLYPWQAYAYDETTGKITILEDRAEKKRKYEEIGREYPHEE
jgi:hypothetical protein